MNLGFQQSRGEIIVTLDADTIIAQDAISLMVRHFEDQNVAQFQVMSKWGIDGIC